MKDTIEIPVSKLRTGMVVVEGKERLVLGKRFHTSGPVRFQPLAWYVNGAVKVWVNCGRVEVEAWTFSIF